MVSNKTIIITGANSGIGLEAAKIFSNREAHVILAVRNLQKGEEAVKSIRQANKGAKVEVMKLDLSDLESVRAFSTEFISRFSSLDILVNNAGVMAPPYEKTVDGFELQFGSNHLGHFALTGLLLPLLKKTPKSRVVTLSSIAHRGASIYFDNLDGSKGYKSMKFYGQSKLANLLFAKELDQRLKQHGVNTISVACHPGITSTNLFKIGKKDLNILKRLLKFFFQRVEMGVQPTIYAATEETLKGGEYIGPDGCGNRAGNPAIETPAKTVYNEETMDKLWEVSETLTGVVYDFS
ncbi:SDR family NAD(P)-dependent oxidoreductase [Anaerobacillus alkaliphilus]|uniref:SDR family NAD(P)-dependent oxidoreductase n=1 Tax=Anaerobacillus alkaliphilus TaxID=1548597 RepID=A0A4Q0VWD8_9BACI|nr:oxidoreductase [Anaerobacillus alkaliphilus]RXJ04023.1 SDR family NAD(P)-dependent oxidoreductase [Anaerobacillus alkaliphilus]